jgi:hypothetical protein
MGRKKDPNQKGSGARKHRRNYRLRGQTLRTTGTVTRYRALHGIPLGRRADLHRWGECPVHSKEPR